MSIALTTPVAVDAKAFVTADMPLLLLGSCFSDSVGSRIADCGLTTLRNPFGVLYNPLSIAAALEMGIAGSSLDEQMLVEHDGLWHSWMHHTSLSHPLREQCLAQCNARIDELHRFLQQCRCIVVTWGTAYAYYLTHHPADSTACAEPLLVANCHKVAARCFKRQLLTVDEIVATWRPLVDRLLQLPQQPYLLFTVSPIRHMADTAHGNQISKSTLLLALDQLLTTVDGSRCHYFPAYEIMMDELRDYRYYDRDMTHPSPLAVDIIWQRFQQGYLTPDAIARVQQGEKTFRQSQHRTISKIQ